MNALDGGGQSFYRVAELYFADEGAMNADRASDAWKATAADYQQDRPARVPDVRPDPRRPDRRTGRRPRPSRRRRDGHPDHLGPDLPAAGVDPGPGRSTTTGTGILAGRERWCDG